MKIFRKALTGVGVAALAGGVLVATGGSAFAAVPTTISNDPGATLGGIDFFNAAGVQITTGSITTAPFAAFAVAQDLAPGQTKINELAYTPVIGQLPANWSGEQLSVATAFPVASPADLHGIANPVNTGASNNKSLATYIVDQPNTDTSTTDGYAGVYVIRIQDAAGDYARADITISGTTWTQDDGTFVLFPDTTTTTLTPTPASPQVPGTNVTLNATVADTTNAATIPVGTVSFYDGTAVPANLIGTAQNVSATGTASVSTNALALGTHTLNAVFTPTSSTAFATSTGTAPYTIGNLDASSTGLSVNPTTATAFSPVVLTATVGDTTTPATTPTGSVQFLDGATPIGSPVALVAGVATLNDTAGFSFSAPGPTHSITAQYLGSATIAGSTSAAVVFTATAPACPNGEASNLCTDPQTVEATVVAGTITITTPYSPANPLNLGAFVLNGAGTQLSVSAPFGVAGNTASEIFVTDTRAGDPNWTASVQSGNFTSPSSPTTPIDGQNAGLIGLTVQPVSGNALTAANVTVTNNPSGTAPIISGGTQGIGGAKHTFAQTTAGGDGSVGFTGTFTLNAPTSTGAGLYTGTVTFTVG
jgi:Big-like domain-containing protein